MDSEVGDVEDGIVCFACREMEDMKVEIGSLGGGGGGGQGGGEEGEG